MCLNWRDILLLWSVRRHKCLLFWSVLKRVLSAASSACLHMFIWLCFCHDLFIDFLHYERGGRLPKMPFRDESQIFQENSVSHGVKLFGMCLVLWFSSEFDSGSVRMQIKFTLNKNQAHVNIACMHFCREDMKMCVYIYLQTHFIFQFSEFNQKNTLN